MGGQADHLCFCPNSAFSDAVYSLPSIDVVITVKFVTKSPAVRLTRASKQWEVRSTSIPASVDPPIGMCCEGRFA